MNSLLEKLSSYNFFNYLLPGIIFVVAANEFTHHSLIQQDIIVGVFLYYFIGLVISRPIIVSALTLFLPSLRAQSLYER